MFLYEGSSAYSSAESNRFDDVDSENKAVLEICEEIAAEEIVCDILPEWFDLDDFKAGFKKLYQEIVAEITERIYWQQHAKYYGYIL